MEFSFWIQKPCLTRVSTVKILITTYLLRLHYSRWNRKFTVSHNRALEKRAYNILQAAKKFSIAPEPSTPVCEKNYYDRERTFNSNWTRNLHFGFKGPPQNMTIERHFQFITYFSFHIILTAWFENLLQAQNYWKIIENIQKLDSKKTRDRYKKKRSWN